MTGAVDPAVGSGVFLPNPAGLPAKPDSPPDGPEAGRGNAHRLSISGQPAARAADAAVKTTPPALEAVNTAGVAATPGGASTPHATLPRQLTPEARTAAFEAVKAEADKPVYKEPGKLSSTERFAQDFIEDAIAEMSGQQRDYPRMSINVWVGGLRRTYTVEQHGDAIRVIGHKANEQEVLTKVLQKVREKDGKAKEGKAVFDQAALTTYIANSQDENKVRTMTPNQVRQALQIGEQVLFRSGFVAALGGKIQDPENMYRWHLAD